MSPGYFAALCLLPCEASAQYCSTLPGQSQQVPALAPASVTPCRAGVGMRAGPRPGGRWVGTSGCPERQRQGPGNAPILEIRRRAGANGLYQAVGKRFLLQAAPDAWKGVRKVSRRCLSLPSTGKRAIHVPAAFNPACGFPRLRTPSFLKERKEEPGAPATPQQTGQESNRLGVPQQRCRGRAALLGVSPLSPDSPAGSPPAGSQSRAARSRRAGHKSRRGW